MIKKMVCVIMSLVLLSLTGCWSYHGLNDMTIVTGVGIDIDPSTKEYLLTTEVVDATATTMESGTKAKLVESRGKTVMDAVRNAKKRLLSKLYWGNNEILVVGSDLAKNGNLGNVIDWFLSDEECRETVGIVVSQEKTAKDILKIEGLDSSVVAFEIKKIIEQDQTTVGTIENVPLFRVFSILESPGRSVVIPAFRNTKNDDKMVVEANGEAVFKGDKMIGYLDPEESKYYLFAVDGIHGGVINVSSKNDNTPDVALEISKNKTKSSYSYTGKNLKVILQTDTDVYLDEIDAHVDLLDENKIKEIETKAQNMIEDHTKAVIKKVQTEYNSDIFGFGNMIYKKDPQLWKQLEPQWDKLFPSIQVEVQSKVNIVNTSFLKHS